MLASRPIDWQHAVNEMALVEIPNAVLALSALRQAGVAVTIDDFGTGRTSIAQMRHLPADTLKVHRSWSTPRSPGSYDLLVLLVNAAHACGLLVVAEDQAHDAHVRRHVGPAAVVRATTADCPRRMIAL